MDFLEAWLARLIKVHPERIELGLARVCSVHAALGSLRPAPIVITVAGTNGKGSTVAFLQAMLRAGGHRVGAFTSPHLFRFNERIVVDGVEATDNAIVAAFEQVESARGETPLTFFEYATLAAIQIFSAQSLDVAIFEVGLGGRLDAVNLLDADVAIVTTIDLDHQSLLGDTRESIGIEKAGIFRAGVPAVIGELDPPASVLREIERIGAHPLRLGHDFRIEVDNEDWRWIGVGTSLRLPHPGLNAPIQHANAAAAIAALMSLRERLSLPFRAMRVGLLEAHLPGRLQIIPGSVETVVDVAHNPQAARVLADWLRQHPRRTRAVFSALGDKDIAGIIEPLMSRIQHWHIAGLDGQSSRGLCADEVRERARNMIDDAACTTHADPMSALAAARHAARPGDRVVVFGSFYLVAALATVLNRTDAPAN